MRFSDGAEWRGDVSLAQNEEERRMLAYEVLSVVEEIPPGKVASYGQIARLAGRERNRIPILTAEDFPHCCRKFNP